MSLGNCYLVEQKWKRNWNYFKNYLTALITVTDDFYVLSFFKPKLKIEPWKLLCSLQMLWQTMRWPKINLVALKSLRA